MKRHIPIIVMAADNCYAGQLVGELGVGTMLNPSRPKFHQELASLTNKDKHLTYKSRYQHLDIDVFSRANQFKKLKEEIDRYLDK